MNCDADRRREAAEALTAAGHDRDAARDLAAAGGPFTAPAGAVLFRPGDLCPGFIALAQGVVKVSLAAESGRTTTLYRVRPGELCLQTFQHLVDGEPYSAEGVAETAVSGVMVAPEAFERLFEQSAPVRRMTLEQVARRFDLLLRTVEDAAFRPLRQRLARALLRLAEDGVAATTHAALAAEIGSSREVVSRQIEKWSEEGVARNAGRGRVALLNETELRRLAG